MLARTWQEIEHWLDSLRATNGAHVEVVEYGSRDWRPSTLLRLRFVTHCTAQFHKPANEQVVVLLKAYKYSPE